MSLLSAIKKDLLDDSVSLASALRRVKIIAAQVEDDELAAWVENELNGYDSVDQLPEYRSRRCDSYGSFISIGFKTKHTQIPESVIREDRRQWATHFHLTQGIRELETLAAGDTNAVVQNWSPELAATLTDKVYANAQCTSAWKELPTPTLVGILDAIRNRLLDFVLDVEKRFPELSASDDELAKIPAGEFDQSAQIVITGSHNVVATNESDIRNVSQPNLVVSGDIGSLRQYLSGFGIEDAELDQLQEAIATDGAPSEPGTYGSNISNWIGDISRKAAAGGYKAGMQAVTSAIALALVQFFL